MWWQTQAPQKDLFLWFNHWAAGIPPAVWSNLTMLGDASVLFCLLAPLLLWRPQMLFALLAAVPLGGLLSVSLKALFQAHRPATLINPDHFNVIGPLLNNASFPSGHTITAFAAAVAVMATMVVKRLADRAGQAHPARVDAGGAPSALNTPNRWVSPIFTIAMLIAVLSLAALVGMSRVAVGAHWPVDVLAGAACGWLAGLSGAWLAERYPRVWQSTLSQFVTGQGLLLTALWLLLKKPEYPLGAPVVWLAAACAVAAVVWQFVAMYRKLNRRLSRRS